MNKTKTESCISALIALHSDYQPKLYRCEAEALLKRLKVLGDIAEAAKALPDESKSEELKGALSLLYD